LPIIALVLFSLILPIFVAQVKSCDTINTLYAHSETITLVGGNVYYLHKLSPADGPATTLSHSAASIGRWEMGRWVYPLSGIVSIPASTWTVTYRAMKSSSATQVVAHGDVDILIMRSDNTVRATIATNVANSPSITLVNAWQTLAGTYDWPGYAVVDETDYLEVVYYIDVTYKQSSKSVRLLVDDSTLPLADQTKIANVIFTYPNQAPVASFTYSPANPLIYETVTFDASASYDPDGSIVSYTWDFGDGAVTTVTNPIITHTYTTAMSTVNYSVTLTVTDNGGGTGSTTQIVPVTNPSILHISLPAGAYVGANTDKWLEECWLLDINANSGAFTLRINDVSEAHTSYDTHLIIALNDAGYSNLVSLTVNSVSVPPTAFRNGEPTPYSLYTWPNGDVYPTWLDDTYVNVGTILPKGYVDVTVSVAFSNAAGARMHFDAYGSLYSVPPPPDERGKVTHNPLSEDSTVQFFPLVIEQYYLTVRTDPPDVVPISGEGLYDEGTNVPLEAPEYVPVATGVRYRFDYWDVDGTPEPGNPITVTMDADHTATAHYVLQYYLTVTSPYGTKGGEGWYDSESTAYATVTPLIVPGAEGVQYVFTHWSGDASGTTSPSDPIVMNGPKDATANWQPQYYLTVTSPYDTPGGEGWYNSGDIAYATLDTGIVPGAPGVQYVFTHWSGDASGTEYAQSDPIFMSRPKYAIANWKTQYYLTVSSPSNSPPYGSPTPTSGWFDAGTPITASVTSPWPGPAGTQYVCTGWIGTGSVPPSGTGTSVAFTLNEPSSITWTWKTQYYLSVSSDYDLPIPTSGWFDEGTPVTASVTSPWPGPAGTQYVCTGWIGTGSVPPSGTGTSVAFTLNEPSSITWTWKTQYQVIFDQTGVSPDFTGTVVTIDGIGYKVNELPTDPFWWDKDSDHDFAFASPLVVDASKKYVWQSTSGLSSLQSGTLHVTTSGSVIGNYVVHSSITFDQTGVSPDFTGTIVIIDGMPYSTLPVSFQWEINSVHNFAFQSPLVVNAGKRYIWNSTSGLSTLQSGSIKVTTYGSIVAHYKTQYYLTLATNPPGVDSPSGAGWYYANTYASITTDTIVDIVPGSSRYRFNGWTTVDMNEITNPSSSTTTALMDKAKTVTANYIVQYYFAVYSPSGSPPYGAPIPPPPGEFFDGGTLITASVTSPWPGPTGTQHVCTGWIGTGSVPPTGTGTSVTFMLNEPSSITWNWETQYYLTVGTSPSGITTIPGQGWYDSGTKVSLTVPYVAGYKFITWKVDENPRPGYTIQVLMDGPHTATAYYEKTYVVGGYSVSLAEPVETAPIIGYTMILAIFGVAITLIRRKRK